MQDNSVSREVQEPDIKADATVALQTLLHALNTLGDDGVVKELVEGTLEERSSALIHISRAASLLYEQGQIEAFTRLLGLLKAVAESINAPWALALYHHWQGKLDRKEGRLESAISHYEKAVENGPDPHMRLDSIFDLASSFFHTGNLMKAESWFQKLIEEAYQQTDVRGMAYGYLGLGDIAIVRGKLSEAKLRLTHAWQYAEKANDLRLVAFILTEQGIVCAQSGDLLGAHKYYQQLEEFLTEKASQLSEEVLDRAWSALATNRATLAMREGAVEDARKLAAEALSKQASLLTEREQIENLAIGGDIEFFLRGDKTGKQHLLAAFQLAEKMRYPAGLLLAGKRLARVYETQGFYEPAYRICAVTIDALERLRHQVGDETSRIQYFQDKEGIYTQMIILCLLLTPLKHLSRYQHEALSYTERAKSRTFIELLGRTTSIAPPANLPSELLQKEAQVLDQLRALEISMRSLIDVTEQEQMERAYKQAQIELDEIWKQIADIAPEYAALRRGQPMTFDGVRELLRI